MQYLKKFAFPLLFLSAYANASDTLEVDYSCSGKQVHVSYVLMNNVPEMALIKINGVMQEFPLNVKASDNVEMNYYNDEGYYLSTSYITTKNYRQSSLVLTAPNNRILFKNCKVISPKADKKNEVSYKCLNNKRVSISYRFNSVGLPESATANLGGKERTLPIDLGRSNNVETLFAKNGYRISTDAMDKENYRYLPINITSPKDELIYKNCDAM